MDAVLSYCHNTLNDKSLLDLLPYFAEKSVGVISASVTSMGLFTKQVKPLLTVDRWNAGQLGARYYHSAAQSFWQAHMGMDYHDLHGLFTKQVITPACGVVS